MKLDLWLLFVGLDTALCFTPGPAVLFVVAQGLRWGGRKSLWANGGILSGNVFYFLLSATGLGAVLLASHGLFVAIKWCGAAFLLWLGLRAFFGHAGITRVKAAEGPPIAGPKLFAQAFALQAANPKALIFFVALLPQFIDAQAPIWPQIIILTVTSTVIEFAVLALYGYGAGRFAQAAMQPHIATWLDRGAGSLLIAAAALTISRS